MTTFTIGMIAAGLWLAVVVAVYLLARNSPGHPFRSMSGFRRARRRLRPNKQPVLAASEPDRSLTLVARLPGEPEQEEIAVLEESEQRHEVSPDQTSLDLPGWATESPAQPPRPRVAEEEEDPDLGHLLRTISEHDASPNRRNNGASRRRTPPAKKSGTAAKKRAAANKPRKIGKLTYVVVDEKGRPEARPEELS